MQDFEKLGVFYLGRQVAGHAGAADGELLLYDAKDLTTHAVCVGMTGSGKTGLCVSLLEEAAIDGVPSLVIDPKGDLGNLMLTFPRLAASDFEPWIDAGEAARKGSTPAEHAARTAELWQKGLAEWGQDGARIERLRSACDVAIYTPGSDAGLPLRVLGSFAAPPPAIVQDADAFRERVAASVSGLLALMGIGGDPVRSREHILLSNLLDRAWREGRDLDIPTLIREVQAPPFETVGVMSVDAIFPPADRLSLSMQLNNLLASPSFAAWMYGEPLDVQRLLYGPDGRPRLSILSIAHLSDAERMFFVTLLLGEVVAWMRRQSGTPSLRALLYMDEVFGYLPPTANPPSKAPMLTLLKQARAFGLGVVLATQNPVDLDYKALSNAGTWFLGRLQTERDKARVLDGLEGAAATSGAAFDRSAMETMLSGLQSRVFLMNNVHDDAPVLFHTRWAMSYLRGPLTRAQIATLMAPRKAARTTSAAASDVAATPAVPAGDGGRPLVPEPIDECFAPLDRGLGPAHRLVYRPAILGVSTLHFVQARTGVDTWETVGAVVPLDAGGPEADPWQHAELVGKPARLDGHPHDRGTFASLPAAALDPKAHARWRKQLAAHLYRHRQLTVYTCASVGARSEPGETAGDFRARLTQLAREQRDLEVEKVRKKFAPKLARLEDRRRRAEDRREREEEQYGHQKAQTAISLGATILGGLLGRKLTSTRNVGRLTTTMRGMSRSAREKGDIERAEEAIEALDEEKATLERELDAELERVAAAYDPAGLELDETAVSMRKGDAAVDRLALVWTPWTVDPDGIAEPAFAWDPLE